MTPAGDIVFDLSAPEIIEGKISLRTSRSSHGRQVDLIYSINDQEHVEHSFVSWAYSLSSRSLVPTAEAIRWKNLLLLFGRRSCLVFDREAGRLVDTIALHRREADDRGFYSIEFQYFDDLLVVVYESGIFAIASTGTIWHQQKMWDDLVAFIDAVRIVVTTGDEGHYALDTGTGRKHQ
ncbi:hypothetical protein ACI2IY_22145 [Lysobacter enzymogenes]|uniref:hypothetical protein n=1 Tax=Lysobacter enzymogenes TaxID=69 RepID=UPI00384D8C9C